MHAYILYSVLPLETARDTHALLYTQHVHVLYMYITQVAAGLRVVKELRENCYVNPRCPSLLAQGRIEGGGLGGQDPPLFCQLRKKFKIVLNHHYYYDIIYVNK